MINDPKKNNTCPRCGHYISRCLCDGSFHCYNCGLWIEPERV